MATPQKKNLLTLAAVARRLQRPYSRLHSLVKEGKLVPDEMTGEDYRVYLFAESSVARVERVLASGRSRPS